MWEVTEGPKLNGFDVFDGFAWSQLSYINVGCRVLCKRGFPNPVYRIRLGIVYNSVRIA